MTGPIAPPPGPSVPSDEHPLSLIEASEGLDGSDADAVAYEADLFGGTASALQRRPDDTDALRSAGTILSRLEDIEKLLRENRAALERLEQAVVGSLGKKRRKKLMKLLHSVQGEERNGDAPEAEIDPDV